MIAHANPFEPDPSKEADMTQPDAVFRIGQTVSIPATTFASGRGVIVGREWSTRRRDPHYEYLITDAASRSAEYRLVNEDTLIALNSQPESTGRNADEPEHGSEC